ncbi:hypothetical protein [Blastococcus sp. SYSU D00813]
MDTSPVEVRIVGPDPRQRRRLAEVLAGIGVVAIEVDGPVCCPDQPTVLLLAGRALAGDGPRDADRARRPALTARQRDVLLAYASSNALLPVVARRLAMRDETVKTHLRRIRAKYRQVGRPAPTRRDLYVRAIEDGLLPAPS